MQLFYKPVARWKVLLAALAVVIGLGAVGALDEQDARLEHEMYCANVKSGTWPDFRGDYRRTCLSGPVDHKR